MLKVRNEAFRWYFHFARARMDIFWRKMQDESPLTTDPILSRYKFTNVYRILDRVSQYLVRQVIYERSSDYSPEDTLFRILIFKIFNKIETWEFLEAALEEPVCLANFDPAYYAELLHYRRQETPIFSAAYMMTGSHQRYRAYPSKHAKWLQMVQEEMIDPGFFTELLEAPSLETVYQALKGKSFIGPFLAYQYAIDFNYSPHLNFDENSFVKAGIGAKRGIRKCFEDFSGYSFEDCIRFTQEEFSTFAAAYDCADFQPLYNRPPTLIDLQNCFCETDKYLRVQMPELNLGNTRIKQKYTGGQHQPIDYFFPPKWNIQPGNH